MTFSAHRARKRFGQHWLADQAVLDRIVAAAEIEPGDTLLEIGPGRGALSERLLASPASRGLLGAGVLQLTPWSAVLAQWLWWPARGVVLLSLLLVGMRLARSTAIRLPRRLWLVLVVKLLLFPLVLLGLCLLLARTPLALPPLAMAAVVLQAAAPTAVAVLLLAEATPQRPAAMVQAAAGLVLVSTLLALVSVPLWAWLLARLGIGGAAG